MKSKKAIDITLQLIVVAAILLVVAVIVIMVFSTQFGKSVGTIQSCEFKAGQCKPSCDAGYVEYPKDQAKCKDANQVCCIKVSEQKPS
ncbi:MAG TPA: hypothetical protein VI894_02450 [Candidatus Nanoarchaeia archaeon]|nr:hypothetical protein [Candidatus Nanoarchaeia archaeon]